MRTRSRLLASSLGILLSACTVVQPITSAATPLSIEDYLRVHQHADLRVTDSSGHARWFYDAEVRGDTLHGSRHSFRPREEITLPLTHITGVGASHFSAGRTAGLVGVALAIVGLMALSAPDPVY